MPYVGNRFKASSLPATVVTTDKSNLFTLPQKIKGTVSTLFTLYRSGISTVNSTAGLDITLDNQAAAEKIYAQYLGVIEDSTTASEKGQIIMRVLHTGALRNALKINNDGSIEWGTPTTPFAKFSAAGLSALRTFTFPNVDTQLVGLASANTWTAAQKISATATNLLTLHKQVSTGGLTVSYNLNDDVAAEKTYARIDINIRDAVAGSEDTEYIVRLMAAGVLGQAISLDETGILRVGVANVQRVRLDCATGLTASRVYTFPNATTKLAGTTFDNVFTSAQTIAEALQEQVLVLRRDENTVGTRIGFRFTQLASDDTAVTSGLVLCEMMTNTVGLVSGNVEIWSRAGGTLRQLGNFSGVDGTFRCGGLNRRVGFIETGLTAQRLYTTPNSDQRLVGQTEALTLSSKTLDGTCNVSAAIGAGGGGGGSGAIAPIANYVIRKDLVNYIAVNMKTNIEEIGGADFYTVLMDVHAALITAGGGKIILGPGDFPTLTKPVWSANNTTIEGCGVDVTRFLFQSAATGTAFQAGNKTTPTAVNLTANCLRGTRVITVASTTGFVAGDWIHLTHEVLVDVISATRYDAEFHQILSIDSGTQLTVDTGVFSDFLTADTARFYKVTWLKNFTLKDMTIYDDRGAVATAGDGPLFCIYCYNLTLDNVKLEHLPHDAIRPESCFNVNFNNLYIEDPQSAVDDPDHEYGVYICGSTTNFSWTGGWANNCRHSVTNNTNSGGIYRRGKQRNLNFSGVKSYNANVAHFDLHQCAIGAAFTACGALGGQHSSVSVDVQGFNLRSPATLTGCTCQHIQHESIVVWVDSDGVTDDFKPGGDRTVITGCTIIAPLRDDVDTVTRGIVIQSNRKSVVINACQFFDCNQESIIIEEDTANIIISNNIFHTCGADLVSTNGIIRCLGNVDKLNITNNHFGAGTPSPAGRPFVQNAGVINHFVFQGNDVVGLTNTLPTILTGSTDVWCNNNPGLNPLNKITNFANNTNDTIGFYGGTTATVVASNDYTVVGTDVILTSTGGTGVSITLKDGAGNTIVGSLTTLAAQSIPNGYIINFGAFSVAPTVAVYAR